MKKIEISNKEYQARQATREDIPRIHAMEEKKSFHYHRVPGYSLARLENHYQSPGFDFEKSIHLIENPSGEFVAHVEVWDDNNPPVHPYIWLLVDPDREGQGLEEYLLEWAEKRALQVFDRLDPDLRVAMRCHVIHANESSQKAQLAAGFKQIRHSFRMQIEMKESPPQPDWPDGIEMRMYDPAHDARTVYEIDEEVFRDHFGYIPEEPEEGFKDFMHHMTGDDSYDPALWFLATEGEEIVGMCICRKYGDEGKDSGHISILGVRRPWRRKGIGLALLQHAFGEFYRRGKKKVVLGVDAESLTGATDLYKKAGMYVLRQFDLYEKELRPGKDLSVTALEAAEG